MDLWTVIIFILTRGNEEKKILLLITNSYFVLNLDVIP